MISRTTKLRARRKLKHRRQQVEGLGVHAEENLERHFFKRLGRLFDVRRFVLGWVALLVLLSTGVTMQLRALTGYYQDLAPIPGGSYAEGVVGSFSNANPIYATTLVDSSVSKLLFAGLLKYDSNNQLVGDLAESWTVDEDGLVYTFILRPGLTWHDGHDLTAEDVAFTFKTIQNPDAKSSLFNAWRGIEIGVVDSRTVKFTLPNPLAPFIYSLTTGVIPKHKLANIQPAQLRSAPFNNSSPIGAGPFEWDAVEVIAADNQQSLQNVGLKAFKSYYGGRPKLDSFVIKTFPDEEQLVSSFIRQEVNSLVGLNNLPDRLIFENDVIQNSVPLTAETGLFFRTDGEILNDVRVRQALVQAVDVPAVLKQLGYPVIPADEPILRSQPGYDPAQKQLPVNVEQAKKLLDDAGWLLAPGEQVRKKGETKLSLRLYGLNNADYSKIIHEVQTAWQAIGVDTQATLPTEFQMQEIVNSRSYDILIYGISIGADPDVFAYWHSSQADPRSASRLNFSNYSSSAADKALESARSRSDNVLRAAKYAPFLQAWRNDAPALMLYQPRFLYITRSQLYGFDAKTINTASDRFSNVENWMTRRGYVPKQ